MKVGLQLGWAASVRQRLGALPCMAHGGHGRRDRQRKAGDVGCMQCSTLQAGQP